jgi:hypothetical protein
MTAGHYNLQSINSKGTKSAVSENIIYFRTETDDCNEASIDFAKK